jgi:hypothetical protein
MSDEYSGILDWEDQPKGLLEFHFLRLLPSIAKLEKVLFDCTSTSPAGHWRVQGSAKIKDGREFQSESLTAFDRNQDSEPFRIVFKQILLSDRASICTVSGVWIEENGRYYSFSGELDRV